MVTAGVDKTGFVKTLSKTSAAEVNENFMSETRSCKKFVSISPFIFRISRSLYTRTGRYVPEALQFPCLDLSSMTLRWRLDIGRIISNMQLNKRIRTMSEKLPLSI